MTKKYRERIELNLKKKGIAKKKNNACQSISEENNTNNTENLLEENEIELSNNQNSQKPLKTIIILL